MKYARLLMVSVIALLVAAVVAFVDGRDAAERIEPHLDAVPTLDATVASATWMCAAGRAPVEGPTTHVILLTNRGGSELPVALTGYAEDGTRSSASVDVPAHGTVEANATSLLGAGVGVLAEAPRGDLVVAHRLVAGRMAAQGLCATGPASTWHFPAASTTRGTSTRLVVFNPFPADAIIDVRVGTDTAVRTPTDLAGVPIAPGAVQEIDLGASVQRRDRFSFTVTARNGRVVAELVQATGTPAEPEGLVLQLGATTASTTAVLADGYTGEGIEERLVVYNPGEQDAQVVIQALPFGALPSELPEPFELTVPRFRFAELDLSAETRIPADVPHALVVESANGVPIVALRWNRISSAPEEDRDPLLPSRPSSRRGVTTVLASPVAGTRWVVPGIISGAEDPQVLIVNPGDGISVVTVSALTPDGPEPLEDVTERELGPGEAIYLPLSALGIEGRLGLLVESAAPVVVELRQTLVRGLQISGVPAVPDRAGLVPTPSPLARLLEIATAGVAEDVPSDDGEEAPPEPPPAGDTTTTQPTTTEPTTTTGPTTTAATTTTADA